MGPIDLLVLDFDGVCTRSAAELVAADHSPTELAATIRPEAEAVVADAARRGIVTAVLSNELAPRWAEAVPLLRAVDQVIVCSDNGILKPDRRAFQRCLLVTGCEAERTLVVDDGADNITVAASLGLRTVLFDPTDPAAGWQATRAALGI